MFDILDEVQYIKDVLANGFSEKWIRDAGIYVRYCKSEGYKKAETRKKLEEKLTKYLTNYNPYTYYKKVDWIMNTYWTKSTEFREIKDIQISQEILDYFYFNKDLSFREKKILFTMCCWCKIQEYVNKDCSNYINLDRNMRKFKQEAGMTNVSNLENKELIHLCDLNYLYMNNTGSYQCLFMDESPFCDIENSRKIIYIEGEDNLHSFGSYLNDYIKERRQRDRNERLYQKGKNKKIICQDCGIEVYIGFNDTNTCRCNKCQEKFRREYKAQKQKEYDKNK